MYSQLWIQPLQSSPSAMPKLLSGMSSEASVATTDRVSEAFHESFVPLSTFSVNVSPAVPESFPKEPRSTRIFPPCAILIPPEAVRADERTSSAPPAPIETELFPSAFAALVATVPPEIRRELLDTITIGDPETSSVPAPAFSREPVSEKSVTEKVFPAETSTYPLPESVYSDALSSMKSFPCENTSVE